MTGSSENIPKQRGTSSGEIGQNPVEIIDKQPSPTAAKPAGQPEANDAGSEKSDLE